MIYTIPTSLTKVYVGLGLRTVVEGKAQSVVQKVALLINLQMIKL